MAGNKEVQSHLLEEPFSLILQKRLILPNRTLEDMSLEDPALAQPYIAVLRKLNSPLHSGLTIEKQELLFRDLIFLFQNANFNIQYDARKMLLHVQITCPVLV